MNSLRTFCSSIPLLGYFLSSLFRQITDMSSDEDEETMKSTIARAQNVAAQKHFQQVQHIKAF